MCDIGALSDVNDGNWIDPNIRTVDIDVKLYFNCNQNVICIHDIWDYITACWSFLEPTLHIYAVCPMSKDDRKNKI